MRLQRLCGTLPPGREQDQEEQREGRAGPGTTGATTGGLSVDGRIAHRRERALTELLVGAQAVLGDTPSRERWGAAST